MYIRLLQDGLVLLGYSPVIEKSSFYKAIIFNSDLSYLESLKNFLSENDWLSLKFNSFTIINTEETYTLIPDSLFIENNRKSFFSFIFEVNDEKKILSQKIKSLNAHLLFSVNKKVHEYLSRSLVNPLFISHLYPMLNFWQLNSFNCYPKQLFINVNRENMDITCFEQGKLLFLNSFEFKNKNGIVYFAMYVCKQLGLNQLEDFVYFSGNKEMCQTVIPLIKNYIFNVNYLYPRKKGDTYPIDEEVPLDLLTIKECEL
jgi:hypothetical protein